MLRRVHDLSICCRWPLAPSHILASSADPRSLFRLYRGFLWASGYPWVPRGSTLIDPQDHGKVAREPYQRRNISCWPVGNCGNAAPFINQGPLR